MKDKPMILVVDDEPKNIELLEAYLVPQGYEIVRASNGEEALWKLSSNQIDLILLDAMLPGMDGFEVIRRIRQHKAYRLLPIILVTALQESEARAKGIAAGCDDFVYKPFDKMELLARVRSMLKVKEYNNFMSNNGKTPESEVTKTAEKLKEAALTDSEKLYYELSIIDELTQLGNFRFFYSQLKIEIERSNRYEQPLTLILLDLDNFKAFNDAYGQVEGDRVLSRFGQVVKKYLRETDFAYRYSGEKFTIILPMTTKETGIVTAEKIRSKFKNEIFTAEPGKDIHITISMGLDQYKKHEDIKGFAHRVDQLMHQAKNNGKDRICTEACKELR